MKPIFNLATSMKALLLPLTAAVASLGALAHAAAPGITGTTFNLTAQQAYLTEPDGQAIYSWGYGCDPNAPKPDFLPSAIQKPSCNSMQVPGPTIIVTEGDTVTVNLANNLPAAAGNTSILFPGFQVSTSGGVSGLLTQEAAHGGSVTYTFTAKTPGTRAYYSGSQGDLQIEMGMYGAIIVLPKTPVSGAACVGDLQATNKQVQQNWTESDFTLSTSAYDDPHTCYDREYLFQFSEIDPRIHLQTEAQVQARQNCTPGAVDCVLTVATEPYRPSYFMINGRSMPDDMDPNYSFQYPHQPYNGNPHLHPGEIVLLRIIGQGRWQHPFHEHANHVRVLARDGNLILSQNGSALGGPALFTTTTTPGLAIDGLFYYTGRGLNWDMYGHNGASSDANAVLPCTPDQNGYNTGFDSNGSQLANHVAIEHSINYYEWCQDHNKPLQVAPFGDVGGGGPATLPDPNILTNGAWYGGSPYLGPDATSRATYGTCSGQGTGTSCGTAGTTPPSGTIANSPSSEAGFAFMWHSHNEREITTNNIFPGGMMMMMLVDSREFVIDETN
jgi:FtsP/CotA-like multicopper oxidase with cupredoxin domain